MIKQVILVVFSVSAILLIVCADKSHSDKTPEKNKESIQSLVGLPPFKWIDPSILSDEELEKIRKEIQTKEERFPQPDKCVSLTKDSVLNYVGYRLSIAFPPVLGIETQDYFFLSGGTTTNAVKDFSTGIAVNKKTGRITLWE